MGQRVVAGQRVRGKPSGALQIGQNVGQGSEIVGFEEAPETRLGAVEVVVVVDSNLEARVLAGLIGIDLPGVEIEDGRLARLHEPLEPPAKHRCRHESQATKDAFTPLPVA